MRSFPGRDDADFDSDDVTELDGDEFYNERTLISILLGEYDRAPDSGDVLWSVSDVTHHTHSHVLLAAEKALALLPGVKVKRLRWRDAEVEP